MSNDKREKALKELRGAVAADPLDPELRLQLGALFCERRNYGEAVPELLRARESAPHRQRALELLVEAYDSLGMLDLAVHTMRKLRGLIP